MLIFKEGCVQQLGLHGIGDTNIGFSLEKLTLLIYFRTSRIALQIDSIRIYIEFGENNIFLNKCFPLESLSKSFPLFLTAFILRTMYYDTEIWAYKF